MGNTFDSVFPASVLEEVQSDAEGAEFFHYDETDSNRSPGAKGYYEATGITFDVPTQQLKADLPRAVSPQTLPADSSAMLRDFTQRSNLQLGFGGFKKQAQQNQLYSKAQIISRFANQKKKQ